MVLLVRWQQCHTIHNSNTTRMRNVNNVLFPGTMRRHAAHSTHRHFARLRGRIACREEERLCSSNTGREEFWLEDRGACPVPGWTDGTTLCRLMITCLIPTSPLLFPILIHCSCSRNCLNRGYVKKLTAHADDGQNPRICGRRTNSVELDRSHTCVFPLTYYHTQSFKGRYRHRRTRSAMYYIN